MAWSDAARAAAAEARKRNAGQRRLVGPTSKRLVGLGEHPALARPAGQQKRRVGSYLQSRERATVEGARRLSDANRQIMSMAAKLLKRGR